MHRRALVTGGAGFIGSHLADALLSEGLEVVVLDNLSMGKRENVPGGAEFIEGDVRSADDVHKSLKGVDIVFHEAARVSIRSSVKSFYDDAETNLMGTLNVLRCLPGSDVKKLVYASSMAVYAEATSPQPLDETHATEPISPYGISKLASEKYCMHYSRDTGIDCHVLRYFNTYGPRQTPSPYVGVITIFIHRLLDGEAPVIFGDGEQTRDFVYVGDIAGANLAAMRSDIRRGIFNVGTGIPTSVNRIAELLRHEIAPHIEARHADEHPGELRYSVADVSRITRELGFCPVTGLEARIGEVISFCRSSRAEGSGSEAHRR
jgi:UDP-glucose 4-epimerase